MLLLVLLVLVLDLGHGCVGIFAMLKDLMFGGSLTVATPLCYPSQDGQALSFHNTKVLRCTNTWHQSNIMAGVSGSGHRSNVC